ncbi:MAG: helix-turn-helix domain-containing protein [Pseudomonadota bacterium]|nr:helix-turn-helix domain-containing protein [Pseudomonadota bacterium]
MKRTYRLKERGERQQETRQRIVEAAIELHQQRGIAATTMGDIAERAGVGRVTVYRHFADEMALAGACSGVYFERNPPPDPTGWGEIPGPDLRLRTGIAEVVAHHRRTSAMMLRVYDESRELPIMAPYHAHWRIMAGVLAAGWNLPAGRKAQVEAAVALALDFATWRFLAIGQGMPDEKVVDLLVSMVTGAVAGSGAD